MKDAPRLYVKNWLEAVQLIEVLRLKGFSECYGRDPKSGKRLKFDIEVVRMVLAAKQDR
jgi:hypothetical protein